MIARFETLEEAAQYTCILTREGITFELRRMDVDGFYQVTHTGGF